MPGGEDRAAAIGGSVVDSDHLEREGGLAEHGVQAAIQVVLNPVHRDDHADQRHDPEPYPRGVWRCDSRVAILLRDRAWLLCKLTGCASTPSSGESARSPSNFAGSSSRPG